MDAAALPTERKRPLLRVDTGITSDGPVSLSSQMSGLGSPENKHNAGGTELPSVRKSVSRGGGKVPPLPTLPTPYMETRASPRVPVDRFAVGPPKPPNRVVLYGKVNLDPARDFGEREKSIAGKDKSLKSARRASVTTTDVLLDRGLVKRSLPQKSSLLANHGAHTDRPRSGNTTQLPAVRQSTGSLGAREPAEEKGKERRLPEVEVQVKVPPPDAHKVGRLPGWPLLLLHFLACLQGSLHGLCDTR